MSLSDCPHCWETPCVCKDAYGYRHLSINELTDIKEGIEILIAHKKKCGYGPDQRVHGEFSA